MAALYSSSGADLLRGIRDVCTLSFRGDRATEKFNAVFITATAGIAIFYLLSLGLRNFGGIDIPLSS